MADSYPENRITVTMISNAMNHHQFPFCDSMSQFSDISFHFIATKPIAKERLNTGFQDLNTSRDYIVRPYESENAYSRARKMADESDFVIFGSAPYEYIRARKKRGKWVFLYSERLFKETRGGDFLNFKTIAACTLRYFLTSHKNLRLLCSSAFASTDYRFFRFKKNQVLKWGYFPPESDLSFEDIRTRKEKRSIIWVGRMIPLKHPELAVELAHKLKGSGVRFIMKLIGDGPLLDDLKDNVSKADLSSYVCFMGAMSSEKVREEMEKAKIMITTSDHNEGWGAVVNEAMSSGCAVVASHLMGSVPFLIKDGQNGRVFESGNADDLFDKVNHLLNDPKESGLLGQNAYSTIAEQWNGRIAAERLAELMRHYVKDETDFAFPEGICSYAERMKNDWIFSDAKR